MVAKKKVSPKSQTKKVPPKKQARSNYKDVIKRAYKGALIGAGVATGVGLLGLAAYKIGSHVKRARSRAIDAHNALQERNRLEETNRLEERNRLEEAIRSEEAIRLAHENRVRVKREIFRYYDKVEQYARNILKSGEGSPATMVRKLQNTLPRLPIEIQLNILEKLGVPDRGLSCASSEELYQVCKRYYPKWIASINKTIKDKEVGTDVMGLIRDYIKTLDDYISFSMMVDYTRKHPFQHGKFSVNHFNLILKRFKNHERVRLARVLVYVFDTRNDLTDDEHHLHPNALNHRFEFRDIEV